MFKTYTMKYLADLAKSSSREGKYEKLFFSSLLCKSYLRAASMNVGAGMGPVSAQVRRVITPSGLLLQG